jgi:hypothetical protein
MALEAMINSAAGPMTQATSKALYESAVGKQTKAEDRIAKIEDAQTAIDMKRVNDAKDMAETLKAIQNSGMSQDQKDRYTNMAPVLGLEGLKAAVLADMKPENKKTPYEQYLNAVENGFSGSFPEYIDQSQKGTLGGIANVASGGSLVRPGVPLVTGAFGRQIESTVSKLIPGATITNGLRSPAKNAAVDGVPNSYHLSDNARDYLPPAGVTMAQMAATLKAKMPGYDVINEGTHVHVDPGPGMAKPNNGGVTTLYKSPSFKKVDHTALNLAVSEGRAAPSMLSARNRDGAAEFFNLYPNADTVRSQAAANTAVSVIDQRNTRLLNEVPEILTGISNAGKKLNYTPVKFLAEAQKFFKNQSTDPDFVDYMNRRNEGILAVARAFRGGAATEFATKLEEQASRPTLSPAGFDAWLRGNLSGIIVKLEKDIPRDKTGESKKSYDMAVNLMRKLGGEVPGQSAVVSADSKKLTPAEEAELAMLKRKYGKP